MIFQHLYWRNWRPVFHSAAALETLLCSFLKSFEFLYSSVPLLCPNSPSPSVIKCKKKELVIGPSWNKPFKLAKAFPRALIWVCCRFLIISVNLLHCPEPLCRCRLLSQAADTLQALCFPCVSPDSAWHQTWEASSGSMKGKKVETWPPRADKAAFSCVISPQPGDKSLRALPLNFSCSQFQPPPTLARRLAKAARHSERTPLYYSAKRC